MKLALIVKNSLNGEADQVAVPVRRTFYAMANELDEQSGQWDDRLAELSAKIDHAVAELSEEVDSVRRLLIGLTSTVIVGVIVGIVNVLLRV